MTESSGCTETDCRVWLLMPYEDRPKIMLGRAVSGWQGYCSCTVTMTLAVTVTLPV